MIVMSQCLEKAPFAACVHRGWCSAPSAKRSRRMQEVGVGELDCAHGLHKLIFNPTTARGAVGQETCVSVCV